MKIVRCLAAFLCAAASVVIPTSADAASRNDSPRPLAYWRVVGTGAQSQGLAALSGADGVTEFTRRGGSACLADRPETSPSERFIYFTIGHPVVRSGPVYLVAEFFDENAVGPLALQYDSGSGDALESRYRPADDAVGSWYLGSRTWRTAVFRLDHPGFRSRQNLGADFRFEGANLALRSVALFSARPAGWSQLARVDVSAIRPLVHIGDGGQLIVGGFDPSRLSNAGPLTRSLAQSAPGLKALGVTSHEVYVRWNLCEPSPGHYDWRLYDAYVAVYKKYHLKWVPFLIFGSAYSLPDWYYKKPGSQGYVCLEHGKESDVQSLWNPALRTLLARFIRAFCAHYRSSGVIESILLGVSGNYGEAIYPVSGNDWTASVHGDYHSHPGYWAGDPFAVASFRSWVRRRYGTTGALSRAWKKPIAVFAAVRPFLRQDAPDDRAWLDFTEWYIGSMTSYARFWLHEVRRNFPHGGIYLCTGGHAPPEHGSDFGDQCKAAAEAHGGVRITNEGSNYAANFSLTRWVASAGRQYGAYFSFEPAGSVDPNGVIARIYNATASGARGLHYYFPNLFDSDAAHRNFVRYGSQFKQRKPVVQIAVYYPETYIRLHGNDFLGLLQPLRDRFDFDYRSDQQIADGGLTGIKALLLLKGNVAEAATWRSILAWVREGGLLIYPDGMGVLRTVEGSRQLSDLLTGPHSRPGRGRVITFHGGGEGSDYRDFLTRALAAAPELSADTRTMINEDGKEDGVYATLCEPHELLWLNYTPRPVRLPSSRLSTGSTLPPFSIVSQQLIR